MAGHFPAASRWLRYCGPRSQDKPPPAPPLTRWQALCLALAALALLYLFLTEFEVLQLCGLYAWHVLFPARAADPCAPCGCAGAPAPSGWEVTPALLPYCAHDLAPLANRHSEPPTAPQGFRERHAAAFDAVAQARLATPQCVRAAQDLAQRWAADVAAGSGGAGSPLPVYATPTRRTLIHLFSRPDLSGAPDGDLAPWQLTTLASILATQPAGSFQVVFWSPDAARPCPPALQRLMRSTASAGAASPLTYRVYDPVAEARGTPYAGHFVLTLRDRQAYTDSDIFRLLILLKYGGLYMDLDVLLFKDLTPLLAYEWATEFSADGRAGHGVLMNNAIVHFFAGSPAIRALAHAAFFNTAPRLRSWAYGPHLLDRVYGGEGSSSGSSGSAPHPPLFRLMPWCFFHGMWSVGNVHSPLREVGDEEVVGSGAWQDSAIMGAAWGLHTHGLPRGRVPAPGSIVDVYSRRWAVGGVAGGGGGDGAEAGVGGK